MFYRDEGQWWSNEDDPPCGADRIGELVQKLSTLIMDGNGAS
jgi:hypothetical protein